MLAVSGMKMPLKSTPPVMTPISGMMMSSISDRASFCLKPPACHVWGVNPNRQGSGA
jgi:hypothetical protein